MEAKLQEVQAALAQERVKTQNLERVYMKTDDSSGLISAIRKGRMKEISPKKYTCLSAAEA